MWIAHFDTGILGNANVNKIIWLQLLLGPCIILFSGTLRITCVPSSVHLSVFLSWQHRVGIKSNGHVPVILLSFTRNFTKVIVHQHHPRSSRMHFVGHLHKQDNNLQNSSMPRVNYHLKDPFTVFNDIGIDMVSSWMSLFAIMNMWTFFVSGLTVSYRANVSFKSFPFATNLPAVRFTASRRHHWLHFYHGQTPYNSRLLARSYNYQKLDYGKDRNCSWIWAVCFGRHLQNVQLESQGCLLLWPKYWLQIAPGLCKVLSDTVQ